MLTGDDSKAADGNLKIGTCLQSGVEGTDYRNQTYKTDCKHKCKYYIHTYIHRKMTKLHKSLKGRIEDEMEFYETSWQENHFNLEWRHFGQLGRPFRLGSMIFWRHCSVVKPFIISKSNKKLKCDTSHWDVYITMQSTAKYEYISEWESNIEGLVNQAIGHSFDI